MKQITDDIYYVGVDDHDIDLFEGMYEVPQGMAYNSYVIMDEKIAVMDSVDRNFGEEWLSNIEAVLDGSTPDYLIVQHMEPDHSSNIMTFLKAYPTARIVGNKQTFEMIRRFFNVEEDSFEKVCVKPGDTLSLGAHELVFVFAPMVHWPEVMTTYDSTDKVFFSADAFGKFGANDVEDPEGWTCEARRYYFGIVGRFGDQVQRLLQKAASFDIQTICPLHGPVLSEDIDRYLALYNTWSAYEPEDTGILVVYTSVYGHTAASAHLLVDALKERGCLQVKAVDLIREDRHETIEDAFRYSITVFATTTYNSEIFPTMRDFIYDLVERDFQKRTVAFVENGTWAPRAAACMKQMLDNCKDMTFVEPVVTIHSALDDKSKAALCELADTLCSIV